MANVWLAAISTAPITTPLFAVSLPMPLVPLGNGLFGLNATTKLGSVIDAAVLAALMFTSFVPSLGLILQGVVLTVLPGCTVQVPLWLAGTISSVAMVTRWVPAVLTPVPIVIACPPN